jgi:RNA polymerase sigma factor (sigma-70 family)
MKYPPPPPPSPAGPDADPSDDQTPEGEAAWAERARLVREALDQLSAEEQLLFKLLFVHELQQTEVAVLLGIEPGNVTRRKQRLLQHFRKLLPGLDEETDDE